MSFPWAAPTATAPVRGSVALPGSKSHTNRAFVLAAVADGPSTITAPLVARDTTLMADALRALGVGVAADSGDDADSGNHTDAGNDADTGHHTVTITPGALHGGQVDTGLAGTVMRFLPPVATLADGDVHFDGDDYARTRPMATLLDALRQAGADVADDGRGLMPFTVRGRGGAPGGLVELDSSASSQFVSGLLLSSARWDKGLHLSHVGAGPVPSLPHIAMTVHALRERGVDVDDSTPNTWIVSPGPISARDVAIEPDLSNAAPFLMAAMVTGGSVSVPHWPDVTDQPGDELRHLLTALGATVELVGATLTVRGGDGVHGIDADLGQVGELTPAIAALAALADSPSRLRGVAHIRGHETDRLTALATEINALGGDVTEHPDGLTITPRPLHAGTFHCYADHRMAQAGAVLGVAVAGIEVDDIACTTKTLADFPGMWTRLVNP